jgi:hypothetical protein
MGRGRAQLGAAVALLLVVAAAGCGQSGGTRAAGSEQIAIDAVAANTEAAGTARFEGAFQPARNRGAPGGHFEGEIDFAKGRSALRSTYDAGTEVGTHETETRLVDGYTYFEAADGPEGVRTAGTTPWYRLRLPGSSTTMLPMGSSVDVTGYLDLLESMGVQTEVVGAETVRGTPTTRYRVTPEAPSNVPAQLQAVSSFASHRSDTGSIELWADDAGRLRRLRTDFGRDSSEEGGGGGSYSLEVFDFGAPVTIEAPPLDQVTTQPPASPDPDAYQLVASGHDDGAAWKVYAAPMPGGRCLAVEADVAEYFSAVYGSDDGGRAMLGCSSSASASSAVPGTEAPAPTVPVEVDPQSVPLADGRALLVSEVPEGTTGVTLRRRDGGTQTVTPDGGWLGAVLAHDEVVKVIEFATPSGTKQCRLHDEFGYSCGPGDFDDSGSSSSTWSSSSSSSSGSVSGSSSASTTVPPPTTTR